MSDIFKELEAGERLGLGVRLEKGVDGVKRVPVIKPTLTIGH